MADEPGSHAVLGTRSGPPPNAIGKAVLGAAEPEATPEEIAFMGSDYIVTIVPNAPLPAMNFIGGTYGPLRPGLSVKVPLWVAINLKKRGKCVIQVPSWLTVARLEEFIKQEREEGSYFCDLPMEFMEVWHELDRYASDDVDRVDRVRVLIADLLNERKKKLIVGLHSLDASTTAVNLNGLTHMEINLMRSHFIRTMNSFRALGGEEIKEGTHEYTDTQTQGTFTDTLRYGSTLHESSYDESQPQKRLRRYHE